VFLAEILPQDLVLHVRNCDVALSFCPIDLKGQKRDNQAPGLEESFLRMFRCPARSDRPPITAGNNGLIIGDRN
jgi:hypothetical protein